MPRFHDIRSALKYTVRKLVSKRRTFIVNIRGPREIKRGRVCTVQVVAESMIYDTDGRGLTLDLGFDPGSRSARRRFRTFAAIPFCKQFNYYEFDDGMPCFAMRFGTDVKLALTVIRFVLAKLWHYPKSANFECDVSDEGPE